MITENHEQHCSHVRQQAHPHCVVCSPKNLQGLRLDFHPSDNGQVTAEFIYGQNYQGYPGILHGGVISAILDGARTAGVRVLVYVVPIRDDVEIPYVQAEYASFKEELGALVRAKGGTFANYESLISGRYWGSKDSTNVGGKAELDFMHFQVAGHRLLADRVGGALADIEGRELKE